MLTPILTLYMVLESHAEAKRYLIFSAILILQQRILKSRRNVGT